MLYIYCFVLLSSGGDSCVLSQLLLCLCSVSVGCYCYYYYDYYYYYYYYNVNIWKWPSYPPTTSGFIPGLFRLTACLCMRPSRF